MSGTAGGTSATDREPRAPINHRSASGRRAGLFVSGLVVAGCLAAAGCTTDEAKIDPKLGVSPSPRVVGSGEPVPKGGGRYLTGKPYKIGGRWFSPMENPTTDYEVIGVASWYGPGFHGRRTANGEVFDAKSLSAAHPTLPLPSYIRVTNLNNDRSIIVRVNDRGPFHGRRVIDVSSLAAEKLDFKRKGMARVRVEYVGPAALDGSDHEKLMASYRGPGQGPAALPGSPEARSVLIASAETRTDVHRPAAAAPKTNRTSEIMLARSGRGASPIAVLQRSPKPAAQAPRLAPAEAPAVLADPRSIELAAATPETLPGVGSALAGAADPAVADPTLAATNDLAMASGAGMILPRPRPGAVGTLSTATEMAALPAAQPVAAIAPAPAAEEQGWGTASAEPVPSEPVQAAPMQVAALGYAPMPSPKPAAARNVDPASYAQPASAPPAAATGGPSSIDDLLSPNSTMPASGFQPMPLTRAPSYAAEPRRHAPDDALARFIAAQAGRQ